MVEFKDFGPVTIWRGAAFYFLPVFSKKEKYLETLIVIFENVSPKGFFRLDMKNFKISVLTANSRYLQTAALKSCIPDPSSHSRNPITTRPEAQKASDHANL